MFHIITSYIPSYIMKGPWMKRALLFLNTFNNFKTLESFAWEKQEKNNKKIETLNAIAKSSNTKFKKN